MRFRLRLAWLMTAGTLSSLLAPLSCGSRAEIPSGTAASGGSGSGGAPAFCVTDAECASNDACNPATCIAGTCVTQPVSCDDGDECSEDACDPLVGCIYRPATYDLDGDGYNAPLAGYPPGAPGACGDDCNDQSPRAHPSGLEVCDGVDNDCNGVIDDGAGYKPRRTPVLVSSREYSKAARGSLVATGDTFALTYTGDRVGMSGTSGVDVAVLKGITAAGQQLFETKVTDPNSNAYAGSLAWSGDRLATAWNDARHGSYDIFYGTFNAEGGKLGPDQQVTDNPGFSLSPTIVWNQSEFLLFWDDRREEGSVLGDRAQILAQRIRADGSLAGENQLIVDGPITENPAVALAPPQIGLAYTSLRDGVSRLGFRVLNSDLVTVGDSGENARDVESPSVHYVDGRFIALWTVNDNGTWGSSIWAMSFDTDGSPLHPPLPVTFGANFARSQAALSLGDRLAMVWADDYDGNYELYFQILASDLSVLAGRQRLTTTEAPTLAPALAAGPGGTLGLLYNDAQGGQREAWFLALECVTNQP